MTRQAVSRGLVVLVGFAVGGALLGVLWAEVVWQPAQGQVASGVWYPADERSLGREAAGTVTYAVVAGLGGAVLGLLGVLLARRAELAVLGAVVLGSALAAYLMWLTGTSLSPPDPVVVAATAEDGTRLPDNLTVEGQSPFLALPVGSLAVLAFAFLFLGGAEPVNSEPQRNQTR